MTMTYPVVVLRNAAANLVLDASQYEVKLQPYNGSAAQQWSMEPTGNGAYFFVNRGNGLAMDIEGGADVNAAIITYDKHGGLNQQWIVNPDQTIVSAADANLAIDIYEANYTPGNVLVAYDRHGGPNQKFEFQYQQPGWNL